MLRTCRCLCLLFSLSAGLAGPAAAQTLRYDVVVYGGTPAGVMAARAAACQGLQVALLEPGRYLGGMMSGGLTRTDFGRKECVGGYSLEFFRRMGERYGEEVSWYFEPHAAEELFWEIVLEDGIDVYLHHQLKETGGVHMLGRHVDQLALENGSRFRALVFIDCSYEGDLMAQSGVTYAWGREGQSEYGEALAGVRPKDRNHQFDFAVPARDANGHLLPEIGSQPRGEIGSADRKVQAYNFRMCLTDVPANSIPFPRPEGYDPHRYKVLALWLQEFVRRNSRSPRVNEVLLPGRMPNGKADFNNRGPFSTDYIGGSWDYPDASYARRAEI